MSFLSKLKLWLGIAGALGFLIFLVFQRVFVFGSNNAKAENAIALEKANEKFREKIDSAHAAGNAMRDATADGVLDIRTDDGHKRKSKAKRTES